MEVARKYFYFLGHFHVKGEPKMEILTALFLVALIVIAAKK